MTIYRKDYIGDPQALVLYAITAACGFSLMENLQYTLFRANSSTMVGVEVATVRAILTVPMHAGTGCVIGAMIARRRFVGRTVASERPGFGRIIAMPVLLHGSFDWVLFARPISSVIAAGAAPWLDRVAAPMLIMVLTWYVGRWQYVLVDSHPEIGRIPR